MLAAQAAGSQELHGSRQRYAEDRRRLNPKLTRVRGALSSSHFGRGTRPERGFSTRSTPPCLHASEPSNDSHLPNLRRTASPRPGVRVFNPQHAAMSARLGTFQRLPPAEPAADCKSAPRTAGFQPAARRHVCTPRSLPTTPTCRTCGGLQVRAPECGFSTRSMLPCLHASEPSNDSHLPNLLRTASPRSGVRVFNPQRLVSATRLEGSDARRRFDLLRTAARRARSAAVPPQPFRTPRSRRSVPARPTWRPAAAADSRARPPSLVRSK